MEEDGPLVVQRNDLWDQGEANQVAQETSSSWPTPPVYRWDGQPQRVATTNIVDSQVKNNFFRSARWCADASAILTTAEDRILRIYNCEIEGEDVRIGSGRSFRQPDAIHAAQWYPSASIAFPETFCFMASVKDTPVRLIDASDGRVRASYPIVDHRERYVSPHCLAFNPSSTSIYCGHENAIEVLDVANPGHDTSERLKTSISRKEASGQKGIISSIAFCTDYAGSYAAGSYNGSVCIYSEESGSNPLIYLEGLHRGGITHLAFHPLSPTTLFIGSRRSDSIQVYDLRDASVPIAELPRKGDTNQRLLFDVDPWGRYLTTGDEDGVVSVFDICDLTKTEAVYSQKITQSAIGSIQHHSYKPLLLNTSGSRMALRGDESDSDSSDSDPDSDDEELSAVLSPITGNTPQPLPSSGPPTTTPSLNQPAASRRLGIWSFL